MAEAVRVEAVMAEVGLVKVERAEEARVAARVDAARAGYGEGGGEGGAERVVAARGCANAQSLLFSKQLSREVVGDKVVFT